MRGLLPSFLTRLLSRHRTIRNVFRLYPSQLVELIFALCVQIMSQNVWPAWWWTGNEHCCGRTSLWCKQIDNSFRQETWRQARWSVKTLAHLLCMSSWSLLRKHWMNLVNMMKMVAIVTPYKEVHKDLQKTAMQSKITLSSCGFGHLSQCKWDCRSSGILRSGDW